MSTVTRPNLAWQFDGTTTDYITGLTGTTAGSISYNPTGKYGQSLIMDGSSYVKYTKTLGYNLGTGGATFAMWFKLLAVPVGANFWIFGASGTSYNDRIYILVGTSGLIGWTFIDNTLAGKVLNSPSNLVVGVWTHLTFTLFDGTMTMYINGSQVATRSDAPMTGVVLDTQFSIAALAGGSGNNINAEYDDFRIYNTALSATQVQTIYNAQGMPSQVTQVRAAQPLLLGNATILYGGAPTGNTALTCSGSYATGTNFLNLGTSSPVNFNFNNSNLFIEVWWYTSNTAAGNLNTAISLGSLTTTQLSYRLGVRLGTGFGVNNLSIGVANTLPLTTQTWYHFAFSADSTNKIWYAFVNGYGSTPTSYTGTVFYEPSHTVAVGYSNALALNYYYDQTIRDVRVIRGGIVPTATFTPEAAPWAYGSVPSYVTGGTNVLGLAAQYMTPVSFTTQYIKSATGGDTVQDINEYRIHTFTTVGAATFTIGTPGIAEVLIVAGGGGGGNGNSTFGGGGGGAGEVYYSTGLSLTQGSYTINVGSGGNGGTSTVHSFNGNSSNIFQGANPIISTNGGGGGGCGNNSGGYTGYLLQQPYNGGSGGGTARHSNASVTQAVSVTTAPGGLGNAGGFADTTVNRGSGGGGATSAGVAGILNGSAGLGGSGFTVSISGTSQTYGVGGDGGGITGGSVNGPSNTGNGGGGGGGVPGSGNGGSGIVIVRYALPVAMS